MAKKRKTKKSGGSVASCSGAGRILGSRGGSKGIRSASGRKLVKCKVRKKRK